MSYSKISERGHLVMPGVFLFRFKELFSSHLDFIVWQFFYLQNTSRNDTIAPSTIADAIGATVAEVNQSISSLRNQNLLSVKTLELNGEVEVIFDAQLSLSRLENLIEPQVELPLETNQLKDLVADFERELGRLLSPFELEDLRQTVQSDGTDPDVVRAALKEAVFNGKTNWNYINAILRNWRKEGITTLRQIEEKRQQRDSSRRSTVDVSEDFLSAMNLWSD